MFMAGGAVLVDQAKPKGQTIFLPYTLGDAVRFNKQRTDEEIINVANASETTEEGKQLKIEMLRNPSEESVDAYNDYRENQNKAVKSEPIIDSQGDVKGEVVFELNEFSENNNIEINDGMEPVSVVKDASGNVVAGAYYESDGDAQIITVVSTGENDSATGVKQVYNDIVNQLPDLTEGQEVEVEATDTQVDQTEGIPDNEVIPRISPDGTPIGINETEVKYKGNVGDFIFVIGVDGVVRKVKVLISENGIVEKVEFNGKGYIKGTFVFSSTNPLGSNVNTTSSSGVSGTSQGTDLTTLTKEQLQEVLLKLEAFLSQMGVDLDTLNFQDEVLEGAVLQAIMELTAVKNLLGVKPKVTSTTKKSIPIRIKVNNGRDAQFLEGVGFETESTIETDDGDIAFVLKQKDDASLAPVVPFAVDRKSLSEKISTDVEFEPFIKELEDQGLDRQQAVNFIVENIIGTDTDINIDFNLDEQVNNARKSLSKNYGDVQIILHETHDSFVKATNMPNARGDYDPATKTIHISRDKANRRTVAHETFHAIFLRDVTTEAEANELAKNLYKSVYKNASPELKADLDAHTAKYGEELRSEEGLSELLSILANNSDALTSQDRTVLSKLMDFFKNILNTLGLDISTDEQVIDMLGILGSKVGSGEVITEEDVDLLNIASGKVTGKLKDIILRRSAIDKVDVERLETNPNTKVIKFDTRKLMGKFVSMTESDRLVGGKIGDRRFLGGIFYPIITGRIWASDSLSAANSIINQLKKDADGYYYLIPAIMSATSHLSNRNMMKIIFEYFEDAVLKGDVDIGLFKERVLNALDTVKISKGKVVLDLTKYKSDVESLLDSPDSPENKVNSLFQYIVDNNFTFNERKEFIVKLLGKATKQMPKNFYDAVGTINTLGKLFSDPALEGVNNREAITVIRFKEKPKVVKTKKDDEFYHESYEYHIEPSKGKVEVLFLSDVIDLTQAITSFTVTDEETGEVKKYSSKLALERAKELGKTRLWALSNLFRTMKLASFSSRITRSEKKLLTRGQVIRSDKSEFTPPPENILKRIFSREIKDLLTGYIDTDYYRKLVAKRRRSFPFVNLPLLPSDQAVKESLKGKQKDFANNKFKINVKEGDVIESRLDIPAYTDHGVFVVTLHKKRGERAKEAATPINYRATVRLKNVKMIAPPFKAALIGVGEAKSTVATVQGEYVKTTPEDDYVLASELLDNPNWTQVGYNPVMFSYFYDREDMKPVVSGSEMVQIGGLLFVKDAVFADPNDAQFKILPDNPREQKTVMRAVKIILGDEFGEFDLEARFQQMDFGEDIIRQVREKLIADGFIPSDYAPDFRGTGASKVKALTPPDPADFTDVKKYETAMAEHFAMVMMSGVGTTRKGFNEIVNEIPINPEANMTNIYNEARKRYKYIKGVTKKVEKRSPKKLSRIGIDRSFRQPKEKRFTQAEVIKISMRRMIEAQLLQRKVSREQQRQRKLKLRLLQNRAKAMLRATIADKAERDRLEKQIPNLTTLNALDAFFNRVLEAQARQEQRDALARAVKVLRNIGKVTRWVPRLQKRIAEITDTITTTRLSAKKQRLLESRKDYVEREENNLVPSKRIKELDRLDQDSLRDMSAEKINKIVDELERLLIMNQQIIALKNRFKSADLETQKRALIQQLKNRKALKGIFDKILNNAFFNMLRKYQHIVEEFDGNEQFGNAYQILLAPLVYARSVLQSSTEITTRGMLEVKKKLPAKWDFDRRDSVLTLDSLNQFGQAIEYKVVEVMGIFAHSLNTENRKYLRENHGLTDKQIDQLIAQLTDVERTAVRETMEVFDSQYEGANRVNEILTGGEQMPRIKNYMPLIFKREKIVSEESDLLTGSNINNPYINDSFTFKRIGTGKMELDLDFFNVATRHIRKVNHYSAYAVPIKKVQSVLADPQVRAEIERLIGANGYEQLISTIVDTANPSQYDLGYSGLREVLLHARLAQSIVNLGLGIVTGFVQFSSMPLTMRRIGVSNAVEGLKLFIKNPKQAVRRVSDASVMMQNRSSNFDREYREFLESKDARSFFADTITKVTNGKLSGEKLRKANDNMVEFSFFMIRSIDMFTAYSSWLGAYNKAVSIYGRDNEELLVRYADDVVSKTQPMSDIMNLAKIQRGSQWQKLIVNFYTAMSHVYNEMDVNLRGALRKDISTMQFVRGVTFVVLIPSIFGHIIRGAGDEDDDLNEELLDYSKSLGSYLGGTVPIFGNMISSMWSPWDYNPVPVLTDPIKYTKRAAQQFGNEDWAKAWGNLGRASGYLARYPSKAVVRFIEGSADLINDETDNVLVLFKYVEEDSKKSSFENPTKSKSAKGKSKFN
jgi:hypothetical protein